ncbi:MAG: DinB family protein [Phycisphaerae bacterium]|nr:DinB family protein [Phycisphaerae bacterium]
MPEQSIIAYLGVLENSFRGKAWQGPTLLGSLRGISPRQAVVVPAGLRHSIWHLVLHATYWKYAGCLRLQRAGVRVAPLGGAAASFERSPSNWPALPTPADERAWRADIALLKSWHDAVRRAAASVPPRSLDMVPPGGRTVTPRMVLIGLAAHDAYHTGQIQLLKKLTNRR